MKDRGLKNQVLRHFWSQGYLVQPEVEVVQSDRMGEQSKAVTDVDVMALRPNSELGYERILADCRTLKGQSPIARALWLRGLMDMLGARRGFVVLSTRQIEADHRQLADQLGIMLLTGDEFEVYDRAMIPPAGSGSWSITTDDLQQIQDVAQRFPRLSDLVTYLRHAAWLELTPGSVLRRCLGNLRAVAKELDPKKSEHCAIVCEVAAMVATAVAECGGLVFRLHLHPTSKDELSAALESIVMGGRDRLEFVKAVRERLVGPANAGGDEPLPDWGGFLQLVRHFIERPRFAMRTNWRTREYALDWMSGRAVAPSFNADNAFIARLVMLNIEYVCRATELPKEFAAVLTRPLIRAQGDAVAVDNDRKQLMLPTDTVTKATTGPAVAVSSEPLWLQE